MKINPKKSKNPLKNPKNPKIVENGQKNPKIPKNLKNRWSLLSFPILGGRDLTRALHSTPFRIQGEYPERDRVVVVVVAGRHFPFLIQDGLKVTHILSDTTFRNGTRDNEDYIS